jgi:uncharacterized protein YwlG (UPF0340 family)
VALLVLSTAGYFAVGMTEHAKQARLAQDEVAERARLTRISLNPAEANRAPGTQLQAFYGYFPAREKAPELIKSIYSAAHAESLVLAQGEYKYSPGKAAGMGNYQVNLPVRGSYTQIRKFIVKVLNSVPSAALEEVSFRREQVGKADLEAKIRFSIYLRVL